MLTGERAIVLGYFTRKLGALEKRIKIQHRNNAVSQRLETIPGIGVIGATAIAATVGWRGPHLRWAIPYSTGSSLPTLSLSRSDGLFRFGFAHRRQVDRALAIVVGGGGGDRTGDGRDHRDRSYVVHLFIQARPEVIRPS
jgi:hypothetical protein